MADELDNQYIQTRQAMRAWQGQMLGMETTVEGSEVHMGTVVGGKPQEGAPAGPPRQAPVTLAPDATVPPPVQRKTDEGRPILDLPDGSIETEKTTTVTDPRINDGKPTNIPTIYGGKHVASDEEAADIIAKNKGVDPDTGRKLEGFESIEEAVRAAQERSAELGKKYGTPRSEVMVDTPEAQAVRQEWQQKFQELSTGETAVKELGKIGKQVAEATRPGFEVAARALGMDEDASATVGAAFVEFMGGLPAEEHSDFAAGIETLLAALPAVAGMYKIGKTVGGAAVEGIVKNKEAILQEFEKAWKAVKSERGSVPLGGAGGGKPPDIPAAVVGAHAEEPLSPKALAVISKREEARQKYGFKVEGFEEELRNQTRRKDGGVLSDEAMQQLAAESGFTLTDLMYLKPGSVLAPEIQLAARGVYYAAADRLTTSAKTYLAMPTPENMEDFAEAFTQGGMATTRIIGTFTETGRKMRLLNQKVPGAAKATGEYAPREPEMNIQDAYIKQMYEFYKKAEEKSKMGGFGGEPGVVPPGHLAQMIVDLPSREAVMNMAAAMSKPVWGDMLYEMWVNFILSNPVTHATNIISNTATILWGIPERAVASMLHPRTIRPSEPLAMVAAIFEGQGDAWRIAWKAFKEDRPQFGNAKLEMPRRAITSDALELTGSPGRAIDYLWTAMGGEQGGWLNKMGAGIRLPGRALMSGDEYFKAIASRVELRALAKRRAFQEINELGLTGKQAAQKAKEIEHHILAEPPDAIKEAMQQFAAYTTYTRNLDELGTAWTMALDKTPMGRVAVPFMRTPGNIFKYAAERTPIAGLALLEHVPGVKHIPVVRSLAHGVADMPGIQRIAEELRAGGERAALAQAKIALGSLTMGYVSMLAANGLITGGGPKDKALRKQWEENGWQAYSFFPLGQGKDKPGFAYGRIEPAGTLVGMAADATDIIGQLDDHDAGQLASALTVAMSRNVANKTFVKGLAGTLNAATSQDVNVVKSFLEKEAGSLVPGLVGNVAKQIDPVQRDVRNFIDAFQAKVPGWSSDLQAVHNLWGEVMPVRTAVGPDFLSPIYSSTYKDDPVINEMNRLEHAFTLPSRHVGGLKNVPDATYWRYVDLSAGIDNRIGGKNLHDTIKASIAAPFYKGAVKEGQISWIQKDIDLFRETALLKLRTENKEFGQAMLQQEMKSATKMSKTAQDRIVAPQLR